MTLDPDAVRAQVERMLRSRTFANSEIHRHLLRYLCEKTLAGEADRLKEYVIALEAFDKPPTYDPKHDSIVRLQIGRLRQKIVEYYQSEAPEDPVRISLPKGAFRVDFEAVPTAPADAPARTWTWHRAGPFLAAGILLVLVWAVTATVGWYRLQREVAGLSGRWTPDLGHIWSTFISTDRPILLCIGTPLFARFPDLGFFRDPKANDWAELLKSERMGAVRHAAGEREIIPWYAFTGAGEASAAILISNLLSTRKREIALTRSNILSWQQLVDNDVIFVGPPKFNPQLQTAAEAQDIVVEPEGIRNLKPRAGEPTFLQDRMVPGKQSEGETHALISLLPGISGTGELLLVAGNASADTYAAAEWLTQPWRASELVRHLKNDRGEIPRHFEIVLKVSFKQGIPVQSRYVLHHALQ